MVNALIFAEKLDASLPQFERPEFTQDHEGFFALLHLTGTVDHASLYYIIRDHDHNLFEGRKATLQKAIAEINATLDRPRIQLTFNDQYYNINDVLKKDPTPYDLATKAIKAVGLDPRSCAFPRRH
jgi:tripeptide aminopeptidase